MQLEKTSWYAMRATYRREALAKQLLDECSIENFIPMRYEVRIVGGRKVRNLVPAVRNLIFVHTTPSQCRVIKSKAPYLQYIVDSSSGNKIIVPDDQMRRFIAVAGTYSGRGQSVQRDESPYNRRLLWRAGGHLHQSEGRTRQTCCHRDTGSSGRCYGHDTSGPDRACRRLIFIRLKICLGMAS